MSILLLNQNNTQLREQIEFALAEVEGLFAEELLSDLSCVNTLVTHVEQYRGKMLRPTLVLVSGMASAAGGDAAGLSDAHRIVATVVELVHMATLVHDDVLDEAEIRRRGCTVNELTGNEAAVMLGDYLISHSYHLCSSLDRPAINHLIADATNTVCEGELLQLANRNNWGLDEQTYFEIIRRKTASLCGTCCRVAALLHEAPSEVGDYLYNYGEKLGIAYQIVDDVLDLVGTEKTVGKTLGRDVQKGKLTLPLIHYLNHSTDSQRQQLLQIMNGSTSPAGSSTRGAELLVVEQMDAVRDLLAPSDSVRYANDLAASLVKQAKASVASLPDTGCRKLMLDMADAVLTRQF